MVLVVARGLPDVGCIVVTFLVARIHLGPNVASPSFLATAAANSQLFILLLHFGQALDFVWLITAFFLFTELDLDSAVLLTLIASRVISEALSHDAAAEKESALLDG